MENMIFPVPPADFNVVRPDIAHGTVTEVTYDSKTLGITRPLRVYTPPGYSTAQKYPVLYLQHGLGNISTFWITGAKSNIIADNLIADGKMKPMLIVYPSGNAQATPQDEKNGDRTQEAYGQPYTDDLLKEIIPYVESHYSVYTDRDHPRCRHVDGLRSGAEHRPDPPRPVQRDRRGRPRAQHPAAGPTGSRSGRGEHADASVLAGFRQPRWAADAGQHAFPSYLLAHGVNHFWRVDGNAHDTKVMAANFYYYAQKLFQW